MTGGGDGGGDRCSRGLDAGGELALDSPFEPPPSFVAIDVANSLNSLNQPLGAAAPGAAALATAGAAVVLRCAPHGEAPLRLLGPLRSGTMTTVRSDCTHSAEVASPPWAAAPSEACVPL